MRRFRAGTLALLCCFAVAACSFSDGSPAPTAGSRTPAAAPSVPPRTIRDSAVGASLTVTAVLVSVLGGRSFTVHDEDLPDQGLLVLGTLPDGAQPGYLITVRGVIAVFDFERLRAGHDLAPEARYRAFAGRKFLLAQEVRLWS